MAELSDIVNKGNNTKSYSLGRRLLHLGMSLLNLFPYTVSAVDLGGKTEPLKERAKIAFVSDRDGNREIYLMDEDGSNQRNISNNPNGDDNPVWSSDGRFLAFTTVRDENGGFGIASYGHGKGGIAIVDIEGGDNSVKFYETRGSDPGVSKLPQYIIWHPKEKVPANLEGNTIYYRVSGNQRGNNNYRLELSTGEIKQTIGDYPEFSADGKIIVFQTDRGDLTTTKKLMDVYASNITPDGRPISGVRLTDTNDNYVEDIFGDSVLYKEIDRDVVVVETRDHSEILKAQIIRIGTDGTGKKILTEPNLSSNINSRWSPDGSKIVYIVLGVDKNKNEIYNMYLMDNDGSNKMSLTKDLILRSSGNSAVDSFSWARDGEEIFYSSKDFNIKTVDLNGNIINLTNSGKDYGPAVQPPLKVSPLETVYPSWDVNQDGVVSLPDLILVGNHFGKMADDKSIPPNVFPDVNMDKVVSLPDLVLVGNHFGEDYKVNAGPPLANGTIETQVNNLKSARHALLEYAFRRGEYEKYKPALDGLSESIDKYSVKEIIEVGQNYPNPFNPETWIPFSLKESAYVGVQIHDSKGNLIREIHPSYRGAGDYSEKRKAIYWDGKNNHGEAVTSGILFYTFNAHDLNGKKSALSGKMVITK